MQCVFFYEPLKIPEPHAGHIVFHVFFHSVSYVFLYMPCIGGIHYCRECVGFVIVPVSGEGGGACDARSIRYEQRVRKGL